MPPSSLDDLLREARSSLRRLSPAEAHAAMVEGALLVDTRSQAQRTRDGEIPGAVVVERNVLEWRLAPSSDHRLPDVDSGTSVIVMCDEGYASSLAAATLRELGLSSATDVIGGFQAWRRDGLPVAGP